MVRKKYLIKALNAAKGRIEQLEDLICPAHQHEWFKDYVEEMYVCKKCRKVVFMDERYPNPQC